MAQFGFLIVTIDPGALTSADQWKADVAAYADAVRAARPTAGGDPVRMPFDRSREERRRRVAGDSIEVADPVYEALRAVASRTA
jgi:LDH2 family malate/lactate/ureidoglycolate dehydrogenase